MLYYLHTNLVLGNFVSASFQEKSCRDFLETVVIVEGLVARRSNLERFWPISCLSVSKGLLAIVELFKNMSLDSHGYDDDVSDYVTATNLKYFTCLVLMDRRRVDHHTRICFAASQQEAGFRC